MAGLPCTHFLNQKIGNKLIGLFGLKNRTNSKQNIVNIGQILLNFNVFDLISPNFEMLFMKKNAIFDRRSPNEIFYMSFFGFWSFKWLQKGISK